MGKIKDLNKGKYVDNQKVSIIIMVCNSTFCLLCDIFKEKRLLV